MQSYRTGVITSCTLSPASAAGTAGTTDMAEQNWSHRNAGIVLAGLDVENPCTILSIRPRDIISAGW